ncbi:hypothetical protein FRC08_001240 [Ceratobasidium sp. 394]|nr:hypothetical protein FRC08_001240 [Ceratobasidium sp. 394]
MPLLIGAMEQWKVAQSQLFDAIDTFHEACVALEAAADPSRTTLDDYSFTESIMRDVASCLPIVKSQIRPRLYSAELILCRMLNTSTSLVPIHQLPPEILCSALSFSIFSSPCFAQQLANGPKEHEVCLDTLAILQLVCSRWRHLVVNTPSLWSHVDVLGRHPSTGGDALVSRLTQTRLARAARAPICLHFHKSVREYRDYRVAIFLQPYLRGAYSIILTPPCGELLVRTISEICSNHCAPDLIPHRNTPCNDLPKAVHLDWPKRAFYGITDLQIESTDLPHKTYHLEHLLGMLSSNPLIRFLRIYQVPSPFDSGIHRRTLIGLSHLELLEFGSVGAEYTLLSMLQPGMVGLDLRLWAPWKEEDLVAIQSFSERSRIKSLSLKIQYNTELWYLRASISSMPHLRALFLDISWSRHHISDLIEDVLLTGHIPHVARLPTDDYVWECSALFPNLNAIGLITSSPWGDEDKLLLAPLVTVYSLDLLVLAVHYGHPHEPPCGPEIWDWVSKHVKSTALVRRETGFNDLSGSLMKAVRLE